jgi:catecholate siderophore receptor
VQVARNIWQGSSKEMLAFARLETTAKFRTFGLQHIAVGGAELSAENSTPLFQNTTGVPTVNLVSPNPHAPFPGTTFSRLYSETPASTTGLYAIDTVILDPQWELTAAVRWDQFISNYHSITYATVPNTPQAAPVMLNPPATAQIKNVDAIATYRVGLVYKPVPHGSIYFAHGTSFNPSAESLSQLTTGRALMTQNAFLPPEMNQSLEFGTKWQFFDDRMQATAAIFRLQKDNARIPSTVPGVNVLGGSQQVDGFELSLAGNIAEDWRARLGYSYLDSHVTASAPGSSILGAPLVNTPRNAVTFWTDYSILPQWMVGLGGQAVSRRLAQNTAASFLTAPAYMTLDASSEYKFSGHYALRLNLYNVLDRTYYDQIHPFRAVPGAGRSALLTLEIRY